MTATPRPARQVGPPRAPARTPTRLRARTQGQTRMHMPMQEPMPMRMRMRSHVQTQTQTQTQMQMQKQMHMQASVQTHVCTQMKAPMPMSMPMTMTTSIQTARPTLMPQTPTQLQTHRQLPLQTPTPARANACGRTPPRRPRSKVRQPRAAGRCAAVVLAGLTAIAAGAACAGEPALGAGSQDMLRAVGPQAGHVADLWNLTLAVCSFVFAAILAGTTIALWRAGRSQADTPADVSGLQRVEAGPKRGVATALGVSIALLLALLGASVATDRALAGLDTDDALEIELTGHQWWWSVRYVDPEPSRIFNTANELHIPVGRPVRITLRSDDVIHSLWVPNLAGKKDLIPGRSATLALRADHAGVYRAQCAEFCGLQHAWMALPVTAEAPERYEAWAAQQRRPAAAPSDAAARRGQQVFLGSTCVMCHAITGTEAGAQRAPDLTHLASRPTLAAGALPNDAGHLAAWISDPQAHKPGANMPGHAFSNDELQALVAYLGSLR